ncbi:MAG: leucine-rich repeat domain-containing protein, partial [Lachnospiraceae bacterium]|nr:leucine-rich repeat domain-containing protein [Lachnospiraceae bacterium]
CTNLATLDLSGSGQSKNVTLAQIGYFAFRDCTALTGVTLPNSITSELDTVHLNNFSGCTNLMRITSQGPHITYVADTADNDADTPSFTVQRFLEGVDPKFYFEGADISATHEFTKDNAIAFKYEGQELYEIINRIGQKPNHIDITYQVNNQNQLVYFNMTGDVEEVVIPETIGPYGISEINSGSFSNNCFLKKITIPASVTSINDGAFKGCHNLTAVMFTNAANVTHIGTEAFATQVVVNGVHQQGCKNPNFLDSSSADFVRTPKLSFTGTVGNDVGPFNYAMSASSTINAGEQTQTYITYYSGWPTNLEIRYEKDPDTGNGAATLVDYPVYTELKNGNVYTRDRYPYITAAYEEAAREAISKYEDYLNGGNVQISDYEWDVINAALRVSVPSGVKAIAPGLFSGVVGVKDADGN